MRSQTIKKKTERNGPRRRPISNTTSHRMPHDKHVDMDSMGEATLTIELLTCIQSNGSD